MLPNADSEIHWSVILSIEGGCPSKSASGNLGDNAGSTASDKYPYKIPDSIKPGTYTVGWRLFNKIGNREMYMNCANVKITGGSSKRDTHTNETYVIPDLAERDSTSFPNMFVANVSKFFSYPYYFR